MQPHHHLHESGLTKGWTANTSAIGSAFGCVHYGAPALESSLTRLVWWGMELASQDGASFAMTLSSRWSPFVASPNLSILTSVPSPKSPNNRQQWPFPSTHTYWGNNETATRGPAINCDTTTTVVQTSFSFRNTRFLPPRDRTLIATSENRQARLF
jgi:hypothetical protein